MTLHFPKVMFFFKKKIFPSIPQIFTYYITSQANCKKKSDDSLFTWKYQNRQAGRQCSHSMEATLFPLLTQQPPVKLSLGETSWIWLVSFPNSAWLPGVRAPTLPAQLH